MLNRELMEAMQGLTPRIAEADHFAYFSHEHNHLDPKSGLMAPQKRKYTGEPYINHPRQVAYLVAAQLAPVDGMPGAIDLKKITSEVEDVIISALLHDVVEDTRTTLDEVEAKFGRRVRDYVDCLSDEFTKAKYPDLNRAERHARQVERVYNFVPDVKTVKLADSYCNLVDIAGHDRGFAFKYFREKEALLNALMGGNAVLWTMTNRLVTDFLERNKR